MIVAFFILGILVGITASVIAFRGRLSFLEKLILKEVSLAAGFLKKNKIQEATKTMETLESTLATVFLKKSDSD